MADEIRVALHVVRQQHPIVQHVEMFISLVHGLERPHLCEVPPAGGHNTDFHFSVHSTLIGHSLSSARRAGSCPELRVTKQIPSPSILVLFVPSRGAASGRYALLPRPDL